MKKYVDKDKLQEFATKLTAKNKTIFVSKDYGTIIPANSDLDNYRTPGTYRVVDATTAATITNSPTTAYGYILYVIANSNENQLIQVVITAFGNFVYMRTTFGASWYNWYRFTTVAASTTDMGLMSADDKITVNAAKPVAQGGGQYTGSLNDAKTPGNYWVSTNNSTGGWPSEIAVSGQTAILEVVSVGFSNVILQRLTRAISSTQMPAGSYIRHYVNNSWGAWGKVTISS